MAFVGERVISRMGMRIFGVQPALGVNPFAIWERVAALGL